MIYTGHSEYLADHGLIQKWPSGISETLVREPLIIGGAGLSKGKIMDALVEMVDFVPTMPKISGIGEHFPHSGKPWISVLNGSETEHKEFTFIYRFHELAELYDHAADLHEIHNLAAESK